MEEKKTIKKKKVIITLLVFLGVSVIIAVYGIQKEKVEVEQVPKYMIEIRVENKTEERFENLKFGILDVYNTVLGDIDFEETDENIARFWVGYTATTDFYVKIKTSESYIEKTFDIKKKDQVDHPQIFSLALLEVNGVLKLQEIL